MKKVLTLLTLLIIPLFGHSSNISPDLIAQSCAVDSGNSIESYRQYGERLAQTLSQLTQEQLAIVFQENTSVSSSNQQSSESPESVIGDAATINEFLELEPINFNSGSSDLDSDSEEQLDQVFTFLADNPDVTIVIEGHTQNGGRRNQRLSENRANAARDYVISLGAEPERIEAIGLSNTIPITEVGNDENRRIEIRLNLE